MMAMMRTMMNLMAQMQGGGTCGGGQPGGLNININQFRNPGFF